MALAYSDTSYSWLGWNTQFCSNIHMCGSLTEGTHHLSFVVLLYRERTLSSWSPVSECASPIGTIGIMSLSVTRSHFGLRETDFVLTGSKQQRQRHCQRCFFGLKNFKQAERAYAWDGLLFYKVNSPIMCKMWKSWKDVSPFAMRRAVPASRDIFIAPGVDADRCLFD